MVFQIIVVRVNFTCQSHEYGHSILIPFSIDRRYNVRTSYVVTYQHYPILNQTEKERERERVCERERETERDRERQRGREREREREIERERERER